MIIIKSKKEHPVKTEKALKIIVGKLGERNIRVSVVALENCEFFIKKNDISVSYDKKTFKKNEPVFFRIAEKYKNASYILAKYFQKRSISYIDSFHSFTRERGKLIQMFLLAINGLEIPKTYYSPVYDRKKIFNAIKFLQLPIVIKLSNKDRGEGVFLAKNQREILKILAENQNEEMIFQEYIENEFDFRILVLGNKAALGEKRIRTDKNDFRNNASRGAREEFFPSQKISKRMKEIAQQSSKVMQIEVCGVDIIKKENKLFVIEVNFSPSFTLNEEISDELNQLADYLQAWNEKK